MRLSLRDVPNSVRVFGDGVSFCIGANYAMANHDRRMDRLVSEQGTGTDRVPDGAVRRDAVVRCVCCGIDLMEVGPHNRKCIDQSAAIDRALAKG